jgi:hypothetical protein
MTSIIVNADDGKEIVGAYLEAKALDAKTAKDIASELKSLNSQSPRVKNLITQLEKYGLIYSEYTDLADKITEEGEAPNTTDSSTTITTGISLKK